MFGTGGTGSDSLALKQLGEHEPPGRMQGCEHVGTARHDRECVGIVFGLGCRLPISGRDRSSRSGFGLQQHESWPLCSRGQLARSPQILQRGTPRLVCRSRSQLSPRLTPISKVRPMNPTNSRTAIETESGRKGQAEHQPESPGMEFGFLGSCALAVCTYFNPNLNAAGYRCPSVRQIILPLKLALAAGVLTIIWA